MAKYKVLWSLRGRVIVEADSMAEVEELFFMRAEEELESAGYEIDEISEVEEDLGELEPLAWI